MRLIRYTLSLISLVLLGFARAYACGPYFEHIPTPCFYFHSDMSVADGYADENIRLWQRLVSPSVSAKDIKDVVYKFTYEQMSHAFFGSENADDNSFVCYINNSKDREITDFLLLAKSLEERRREHNSPWFYPAHNSDEAAGYQDIINTCRQYAGTRLADRYALQLVRALFAATRYDECINEYEKRLEKLPVDNLFRRMALAYVAGCWSRMSQIGKANEYFAEAGDFKSIKHDDALQFMAYRNPDAPSFMSHIGYIVNNGNADKVRSLMPVARQILKSGKSRFTGNWLFLMAYIEGTCNNNYREAASLIRQALHRQFSCPAVHDYARAYRMVTDAESLNKSTLLADLLWIEQKINPDEWNAEHWNTLLKNIIQMHWVNNLMEQGDCTLAALLAGYADNYFLSMQKVEIGWNKFYGASVTQPVSEARKNPRWRNSVDYSGLSFRLMYSMTGDQLARVKAKIGHGSPLQSHLEKYARVDNDYLNELIGTVYIREQQYDKAVKYLSPVSVDYQRLMNIYEGQYLAKDPFCAYDPGYKMIGLRNTLWIEKTSKSLKIPENQLKDNAKLRFAQKMSKLKQIMTTSNDPGERALAACDYAVGLRNSFEGCWALTQYYRGCIPGMFEPSLSVHGWADYEPLAKWIIYYTEEDSQATESRFNDTIDKILASTHDPETLAAIHWRLHNLRTVAKHYPNTEIGKMLASSCDSWKDWIK